MSTGVLEKVRRKFNFKPRHGLGHRRLHTLLKAALDDLEVIEQNKNFKVNMSVWCYSNGICEVCFGGAYAISGGGDYLNEIDIDQALMKRMSALDNLRSGSVLYAVEDMYDPGEVQCLPYYEHYVYMPVYGDPLWWPQMRELLADLTIRGL